MPIEHQHTIKAGSVSKLLLFFAADAHDPAAGASGLSHEAPGALAAYFREGETAAHPVPLAPGRLGQWAPGSLTEVDAELMPGVYQLGAPDEMLARGSTRALLLVRFPGAMVTPIEISLVAYDPQDSERIGVSSLANAERHKFLRRAMPRLTEMELGLGAQAEGELRRALTPRPED
jgi:hypothetical protein